MWAITGHKGFVGQYLTKKLDDMKVKWVGYDLKDGNDIRDKYKLYEFFDFYRPSKVIHLAALAGVRRGEEFPDEYISTNVNGTLNVVKMCEEFGVERLINFSSSSVYGDCEPPVRESTPKNPKAMYGLTKLMAEKIVENSKVQSITIRPFTIYGMNGRPDMVIYKWIQQINEGKKITFFGDGSSKRGYVNVEDLVEGVINCLSFFFLLPKQSPAHIALNLGGQEVISLNQLLEIFTANSKKEISLDRQEMPSVDIYANWADISLAETLLDWKPKRSFEDEIKKIIEKEINGSSHLRKHQRPQHISQRKVGK